MIGQGGRGGTQERERPMSTAAYGGKDKEKEREVEREEEGKEEEKGHRVVGGRWAPPPIEGKGPREGRRMAIG